MTSTKRQARAGLTTSRATIFVNLLESIEATLLAGKIIRVEDFPQEQRPYVFDVIELLCADLPIRREWEIFPELYFGEHLRLPYYRISDEFLDVGHE